MADMGGCGASLVGDGAMKTHNVKPSREFYQMMDRLAVEIARVGGEIRMCAMLGRKNERAFNEGEWEELVLKHMEFEDILYSYRPA